MSGAMDEIEKAKQTIDAVPKQHPFEKKYEQIEPTEREEWAEVVVTEEWWGSRRAADQDY